MGSEEIRFVKVEENGVSTYRGALCRSGGEAWVCGMFAAGWRCTADEILNQVDFVRGFDFSAIAQRILNRVAADGHIFCCRNGYWGWFPKAAA